MADCLLAMEWVPNAYPDLIQQTTMASYNSESGAVSKINQALGPRAGRYFGEKRGACDARRQEVSCHGGRIQELGRKWLRERWSSGGINIA